MRSTLLEGVKSGEHSGDTGMWPVSQILIVGERGEREGQAGAGAE